jgi:hypothetical protein
VIFSFANPAWINFVSRCELAFEFADGLLKRRSLHWLGWPAEREQTVSCHCVDADSVGLIAGEQRDDRRAFWTGDLDRPIHDRRQNYRLIASTLVVSRRLRRRPWR